MTRRANALVRGCLMWLQANGVMAWRQNTSGMPVVRDGRLLHMRRSSAKGAGDVAMVLPGGRYGEVECKTGSGRLTPEQRERGERLMRAGAFWVCVHSVAELLESMSEYTRLRYRS